MNPRSWPDNAQLNVSSDLLPGPVISAVSGDTLIIRVYNELDEPTSVHWHGLRLERPGESAQDGTVGVTQVGHSVSIEPHLGRLTLTI
jgi:FtsP/CotA-like multicopper oxidase with cupredoxin domain